MTTANVNLGACDCHEEPGRLKRLGSTHVFDCASTPLPIPCPIPRSVTMTVRPGECTKTRSCRDPYHSATCPARPIRVSCSIGGTTWEESEVTEVDWHTRNERGDWNPSPMSHAEMDAAVAACRARWEIVKALVTGAPISPPYTLGAEAQGLLTQRDEVFAALADMARCERSYWAAAQAVYKAIPGVYVSSDMQVTDPGDQDGDAPSKRWLGAYVEHLIEQVGQLA